MTAPLANHPAKFSDPILRMWDGASSGSEDSPDRSPAC